MTIVWPSPGREVPGGGVLCGWGVRVLREGVLVPTVTGLTVAHAEAAGLVWAELTMFADAQGRPVYDAAGVVVGEDGEPLAGTFVFRVAEMLTDEQVRMGVAAGELSINRARALHGLGPLEPAPGSPAGGAGS